MIDLDSSITHVSTNGTGAMSSSLNGHTDWKEEALRSLQFRFAEYPDDAKLVLSAHDGNGFRTHEYSLADLNTIAQLYAGREGLPRVYTRMSVLRQSTVLTQGQRGRKTDTYGCALLWVDIDPDGTDDFRERKLDEIRSFHIPPSAIEDSGRGYYAFWRIPFTEDWEWVEKANKWLAVQLNGEGFDVTRVLRLPGTFNDKPDCLQFARVIEQHPGRVYTRDDFKLADLTQEESDLQTADYDAEPLPLGIEDRIRSTSERLWNRIYSEEGACESGTVVKRDANGSLRVDRSRNDFYIARELLRLGLTQGQVFSVLTHPTWFSGSKFREHRNEAYVKRTIESARRFTAAEGVKRAPEIGRRLLERYNLLYHLGYWYRYDPERGVYVEAENELRLAVQAYAQDSWTLNLERGALAYLEPHASGEIPQFDLINVENGMLDWQDLGLKPHSAGYRSIMQVQAAWDPDADCTAVDAFVAQVLPDDLVPIWWMFAGYCLYTKTPLPYRCLFAIVGRKRTGKSTLLQALAEFLGRENISALSLSDLTSGTNRFATSGLVGKMLNMDLDAPYDVPMKGNHDLKKLAVGEPIPIERKNRDADHAALPIKLAFAMNEIPTFGVAEEALYDRWVVLTTRTDTAPFTQGNRATKVNAHLELMSQKANRNAWLKRSIEGLRALVKANGFPETEAVKRGRDLMRQESDSVYSFWIECTGVAAGHEEPMVNFYRDYQQYVNEGGGVPVKVKRFNRRSRELAAEKLVEGLEVLGAGDGYRQVIGIGRRGTGGYLRLIAK